MLLFTQKKNNEVELSLPKISKKQRLFNFNNRKIKKSQFIKKDPIIEDHKSVKIFNIFQ